MIYEEDKQLVVNFMLRSTKLMHGHLPHVLTPAKEREREREREREGGGGLEISSDKNDYYCYLKKKKNSQRSYGSRKEIGTSSTN